MELKTTILAIRIDAVTKQNILSRIKDKNTDEYWSRPLRICDYIRGLIKADLEKIEKPKPTKKTKRKKVKR
jgi:hypothetical protein